MRLATVTPLYKHEQFVRPHFNMLKAADVNIVLRGKKPFRDYVEAGMISEGRDKTFDILAAEYPHVKVYEHEFEQFGGPLLNFGLDKAKENGCDVMLKLDVDMFLTPQNWEFLIDRIHSDPTIENWMLDYRGGGTTVIYKDFSHMVSGDLFDGLGANPIAVKTDQRFVENGVDVAATGNQGYVNAADFTVYHFAGWKENADALIKHVESLPRFNGWEECPDEIKELFNEASRRSR